MFLRNGWYAAIWSKDLQDKPIGRTFLNEKVVLFRNASGRVAALEDCCCHRAAPLSKGEIIGDYLACGYHGLKYDLSGRCVESSGTASRATGRAGEALPGRGKMERGLDLDGRTSNGPTHQRSRTCNGWRIPAGRSRPGYIHLKSNYQFLVDNLLDLTHVSYVHKNTLAGDPREATTPTRTERLPDGVRVGRWMIGFVPPPLFAKAGNFHRQGGSLAVRDLEAARNRLSRRWLRQHRHRRAGRRPQPGHLDLVEPPGHARNGNLHALHVLLCPQLQSRRSGNVEADV